ncbi:MAG: hypothetical protein FWB94_01695, partial [Chitinispirillia bacterium]|nr:hypothetical protein [Chitinispirillia bacterium]
TRPGHRVPPDDCTTAVMSPDGTLHPGLDGCGKNVNFPYPPPSLNFLAVPLARNVSLINMVYMCN